MYLTEYDEEKERALAQEESRAEGRTEGRAEERERVASDMLKRNMPLSLIKDLSLLSEEVIMKLAQSLGITVA